MDKDVDATDTSSIKEIALYSSSIYLTGSTVVLGDPYAFVRKYDTTGNVVWTKIFRPESGYVTGNSIVADSSGIYVAGKVENGLFPNQTIPPATGLMDAFIRKFDLNGESHLDSTIFRLRWLG